MYHDIMDRVRNTAETFQNSCMFKSWWRNTFCTLLYFLCDMAAVSCFLSFLQTHAHTHTYTHTVVCVVCRWVHHTLMFKEQGCSCVLWSDPLPKIHPSSPFLIHNHTHTMRRHTHTCAVCADTHTHGRASWLSAMTDVLTVCGSGGMVVLVVLQGFDTRCISIHYAHVTLIRLYPLAAFCLQPHASLLPPPSPPPA